MLKLPPEPGLSVLIVVHVVADPVWRWRTTGVPVIQGVTVPVSVTLAKAAGVVVDAPRVALTCVRTTIAWVLETATGRLDVLGA